MSNEDNILFSEYFYLRKDLYGFIGDRDLFNTVLNFVLNSKEMTGSLLNSSSNKPISTLLSLVVIPLRVNSFNSRICAVYTVDCGGVHENRIMDGYINFSHPKVVNMCTQISRFDERGFLSSSELVESFSISSDLYERFYDYSNTNFCGTEYFSNREFSKALDFKENAVKLMRKRCRMF